jgi:hypothetical protein
MQAYFFLLGALTLLVVNCQQSSTSFNISNPQITFTDLTDPYDLYTMKDCQACIVNSTNFLCKDNLGETVSYCCPKDS